MELRSCAKWEGHSLNDKSFSYFFSDAFVIQEKLYIEEISRMLTVQRGAEFPHRRGRLEKVFAGDGVSALLYSLISIVFRQWRVLCGWNLLELFTI